MADTRDTPKPDCGCGHSFLEHEGIELRRLDKPTIEFRACLHMDRAKGALATVCGCGNYKPRMTAEQRFKNIGYEMLLAYDENIEALTAAQLVEEAWEKYNQ